MLNYQTFIKTFTAVFLSLLVFQLQAQSKDVVKERFYEAMSSTNLELIQSELDRLEKLGPNGELAYKGALVMKKAGLLEKVGDKFQTFKRGKEMLEKAIAAKPYNPEFRFLRLMIQENAPSILGYGSSIESDADIIHKEFDSLSPEIQDAIVKYSKNSEILKVRQ